MGSPTMGGRRSSSSRKRLRAPLVVPAAAVSVGIVIDRVVEGPSSRLWAILAMVSTALAWWAPVRSRVPVVVMALIALGAGWHHVRWSDMAADDLGRFDWSEPTPACLRGVLAEVPEFREGGWLEPEGGSTRSILDVRGRSDGRNWHRASGRVLLYVSGDRRDLKMGQPVTAAGSVRAIEGPRNPGESDQRDRWKAEGVRLRMSVGEKSGLWGDPEGDWSPSKTALGWLRERSHRLLTRNLGPDASGLASALLLGRRDEVSPETRAAFALTGTSHLLAISGLHMQAVALLIGLLLLAVGVGRRQSAMVVLLASVGYAVLVGAAPSVVRSLCMTVVLCLAVLLDRPTRKGNVLAFAWICTLALNPAYLFDVGCQLSFLAVAALVWGVAPVARRLGLPVPELAGQDDSEKQTLKQRLDALERRYSPLWKKRLIAAKDHILIALTASAVVWVWTLPLVVLRFHLVPWVGIVLNVPLVPLSMPTLASAGATLVLSFLVPPLAPVVGRVCGWFMGLNEWLVRWGSSWPLGHHYEPGPPGWWVAGFYGLLALAVWAWWARSSTRRKANLALAGWSAVGLALAVVRPPLAGPEAHVLAVDHGLAVVVRSSSGQILLYDCGKMRDPGIGRRVVAPALWSMGVRKIDYVVLSHADEDHYDGLPDLLDRFTIGKVLGPPGFDSAKNPRARALVRQCRDHGVTYEAVSAGSTIHLGPRIKARVLHPADGWQPDAPDNARSVVLELTALGRRVLLTGDLEGEGQAELMTHPAPSYDAMLAPHHGGKTANPARFYDWGRPRKVIVSQKRPTGSDALEALERQGHPVHRTWKEGAVALRWKSAGLDIHSFLGHKKPISHDPITVRAGFPPLGLLGAVPSQWVSSLIVVLAFVAGLGACLVWGVVEWGAWALVSPGRRHDPDRPDEEPAPWEPLSARASDGTSLRGAWLGSDQADGRTLALLHGFGEDRSALLSRAEALSLRGWNVAVLDSRGRGQSEGDRTSFGGRESHDLLAWLDVLSERLGPDARLAAWGRSMGATTVLKAAVEDKDGRLRAVVLEAPYPDLKPAVKSWLSHLRLPGFFAGLLLRRAKALAGVSLHEPTPLELAASVHIPALLLAGSDDPLAPPDQARRLASAFPSPATVIEVPGARHADVFDLGGDPLADQVAAFLNDAVS